MRTALKFLVLIILLAGGPLLALAQIGNWSPSDGIVPKCQGECDYQDLIQLAYNFITFLVLYLAVPLATASIFYAGILYVGSGAKIGNRDRAKEIIKLALFGVVIALAAQLIVTQVYRILIPPGRVNIPVPSSWHGIEVYAQTPQEPSEDFYQGVTPSGGARGGNPLQILRFDTIPEFIHAILSLLLQIGWPLLVLAIIYSGFLFVVARGNESKISQAKDTARYTLIGAAIMIGVFVIEEVIQRTILSLTN